MATLTLHIHLLGDFSLTLDSTLIPSVNSTRLQSLLAYLLLHRDAPQLRSHLAFILWPDTTETNARNNLRQLLFEFRRALTQIDHFLIVENTTVQWRADAPFTLDVAELEHAFVTGALQEAVDLYRGDLLPSCYDDWILPERERLRQQFIEALDRLIQKLAERNDYRAAIRYTQRALQADPWREETSRLLMDLYASCGDRAGVTHAYNNCATILKRDLSVEPSVKTRDVYEQSLKLALTTSEGRVTIPATPHHNLPTALTNFVGRHQELEHLGMLLDQPGVRLVTIIGTGGMGKTRLVLEATARRAATFANGVYFVSLTSLASATSIVSTIANALNFSFYAGGEPKEQLLDYLREKHALLILDNFDRLLDGAPLVSEILRTAPHIQCIATSRERLNLHEEYVFPLQGLQVPERETVQNAAKYDAVMLFLQSARRVKPDFVLKPEDFKPLIRICNLVQGMPLGLELAASWIELLSLSEIVTEISKNSNLLENELRNVPERHRSLRAVFAYSWNLLGEAERNVLQQLSIFRGGCTRNAAEQIAGASLRVLATLINKSLLSRRETGRYELQELFRQYLAQHLGQAPDLREAVQARHSEFYLTWLHQKSADLESSHQQAALGEIETEIDNLRVAAEYGISAMPLERWAEAIDALIMFYFQRARYQDGEDLCRMIIKQLDSKERDRSETLVLAKTLAWHARIYAYLGNNVPAKAMLERSLLLLDEAGTEEDSSSKTKAFALWRLGRLADISGDRVEAERQFHSSLALFRLINDRWDEAVLLHSLANLASHIGEYDQAKQYLQESLAIWQALQVSTGIAWSLDGLASVAINLGQFGDAEQWERSALALFREVEDRYGMAVALGNLGFAVHFLGRFDEMIGMVEDALAIFYDLGSRQQIAHWTALLSVGYVTIGKYQLGKEWVEKGLVLGKETGFKHSIGLCLAQLGHIHLIQGDPFRAKQFYTECATLFREIRQRTPLTWSIAFVGLTHRTLKAAAEARQCLIEGLEIAVQTRTFFAIFPVSLFAVLLADKGETERAVELYALVNRYPFSHSQAMHDLFGYLIDHAATSIPSDVVAAARVRGQARDLHTTVCELLEETRSGKLFD